MRYQLSLLAAACLLSLMAARAYALVSCTVNAAGVAFGVYDTLSVANVDRLGTISVVCSGLPLDVANYSIALTAGGGTFPTRLLSAGANTLSYNVYVGPARSVVWGDGNGNSTTVSDTYLLTTSPTTRNYTVYGRLPGSQSLAPAGSYSDVLTVTLTY